MRKLIILLLFVNISSAQYNLFARQNFEAKKSTFSYLLDVYPNAVHAYSFRKLRSAYTGYCVKVRRSSDNTTLDIGFVNNVLDTSSLLAFTGGGNGFIEIWYDQSTNANNMVQATTTDQPQLVLSGSVITNLGKPAFYSPKTAQLINTQLLWSYSSSFTVCKNELAGNDAEYMIPFGTATTSNSHIFQDMKSGGGYVNYGLAYKNGSASAVSPMTNGNFYTVFHTGVSFLISQFFATTATVNRGLAYNLTYVRGVFYVNENVTYNSDQNSNKTGIENNINSFYSIY